MICLPCSSLLFDLKYTPTRAHSDTPYSHNYTLTQSIIQTHTHTEAHVNTQISNQIVIFLAGGPARLPSLLDSELFTPPWDTARSFLCPSLCEPQFTFWKMRTAHPGCLTGPPWKPSERREATEFLLNAGILCKITRGQSSCSFGFYHNNSSPPCGRSCTPRPHTHTTGPPRLGWLCGARSVPRARKPCAFVRPEPRPGWYPLNHSVGHQKQPLLSESSAVPLIFFKATRETEPYKCFKQSSEVEAKFLLFPPLWQAAAPFQKQAEVGRGEKAPGSGSP